MPSLLDRAKILTDRMAELGRIDVERSIYERLKTRADQVHRYATEIKSTAASISRMRAQNIPINDLPAASKELRRQPATLAETLKSDPQVVANDNVIGTAFINPLQSFSERFRSATQSAWREYVGSIVPKINEGSLEMLSKAGFTSQVSKFRKLRDEARVLRETLPTNDTEFLELKTLASEIARIWGELTDVPTAVMNFLNKAVQRSATFADLTPEVNEWLKNKGLLSQLRIGLG